MQKLYHQLAKYYDRLITPFVDTESEVNFLDLLFARHNVKGVLDLACGTGRHSIELTKRGYFVLGVDNSQKLIEIAKSKSQGLSVEFQIQDIRQLKLSRQFDAAICMWSTFGEIPYKDLLLNINPAIKNKGLLVIDSKFRTKISTKPSDSEIYQVKADDTYIKYKFKEYIKEGKRFREIIYEINDEIIKDFSEMDILNLEKLKPLVRKYGFDLLEIYFDYKKNEESLDQQKRVQIICIKTKIVD